jgi:hypothetical protein
MKTLSKDSESLILDAIQDVCEHVGEGARPTEAVVKTASDRDLPPNFVRLVCQGYNTGATNYQREKGASVLEKLAEFPLADADQAIAELYPKKPRTDAEKVAESIISSEYSSPPRPLEKVAKYVATPSAPAKEIKPEPKMAMKTAFNKALDAKRSHNDQRHKYAEAQDSLLSSLGGLGEYFQKSSYDRSWAFADVDTVASRVYGDAGREVMSYIHSRNNSKEKRSTDYAFLSKPVDWGQAPFTLLDSCIKAAHEVSKLRKEYKVSYEDTRTKVAELTAPFVESPNRKNFSVLGNPRQEKSSGIMQSIVGSSIAKNMATKHAPPSASMEEEKVHRELTDPDHLNDLRAIKAKAQLYDYLRNDEIISGYDPEEVLEAYNEIAGMNPRSATQPAIMRPLLRKRLTAGAIEPYEAKEMADIEKTLAQTEAVGAVDESGKEQLAKESNVLNKSRILG